MTSERFIRTNRSGGAIGAKEGHESYARMASVPVLAMPAFAPEIMRKSLEVAEGTTIAEAVDLAVPFLGKKDRARLSVSLVSKAGDIMAVPMTNWRRVRPRPGALVVIRALPGDNDTLRSVLLAVVSVAAIALGQVYGPALFGGGLFGALGTAAITAATLVVGSTLVNTFLPSTAGAGSNSASSNRDKPTYQISSWTNTYSPGAAVPAIMGRHRIAPPFAVPSYTEIVGDQQYVRAVFCVGHGPVAISDIKIGETPIASFDEVTTEIREGYASDTPLALYPQQIIEEQMGVELRRDLPRDDAGDPTGAPGVETPVSRFTATDASEVGIIFGFPAGLVSYNDAGDAEIIGVTVRIRQRPSTGGAWSDVTSITYSAKRSEPFFRFHRWSLPTRGRYEIEVTRMTDERTDTRQSDRTNVVALQSFRPEYPIVFDRPLALVAMRIKATYQLNGSLSSVNMIAERVAPDWTGAAWVTRATRNPASLYRYCLQNAGAYPVSDAGIDLAALEDWADYCIAKGLRYDRWHDFNAGQYEVLMDIAAAGRAAPRYDGEVWSVVVDRPQDIVVDHINPRNSKDFSWKRTYVRHPDALTLPFLDETADYASRERIVPWPGQTGNIEVTEELSLIGKTDPQEVWIEARRRQYETGLRADIFTVTQQGAARVATRGDKVLLSHDVLVLTQAARRVLRIHGNLVTLDGPVVMETGKSYGCRFQLLGESGGHAVATNVQRAVETQVGETDAITLTGTGERPERDTIVHFGIAGEESLGCRVKSIEAGNDMSSVLTLVLAAEEIEDLLDAEIAPPWDGRAGGSIANDTTAPALPVIAGIALLATGATILLSPGAGGSVEIASYVVRHRLVGAGVWTTLAAVSAGAGAVSILGYDPGDTFEFQAQAVSLYAVASGWTAAISRTVPVPEGAPDPIPSASATAGLGVVALLFATPSDTRFAEAVIYRNTANDFATATEVARLGGLPGSTYSYADGDGTRSNLIGSGGFENPGAWIEGMGWSIGAGMAEKTPGDAGDLTEGVSMTSGQTYRYGVTVLGRTDGTVQIALQGGARVGGASFVANGVHAGALVAAAGNDTLAFEADDAFDGRLDDVVLFRQTSACLAQGDFYYFITAANAAGDESAPIGIAPVTVI